MNNLAEVRRVYVAKDVAVGTPANVSEVPAGAIAIYNENMELLTPGSTIQDTQGIYIVQGTSSYPRISPLIKGSNVKMWTGSAYQAATKKKYEIGYAASATTGSIIAANSKDYTVVVKVEHTDSYQVMDRYHYTSDASATQEEIADGIINAINTAKSPKLAITATKVNSGANYGVAITSTDPNIEFSLVLQGGTNSGWGATNLVTTNLVYSAGRGADVVQEEKDYLGYLGQTNNVWFPFSPETFGAAGTNYDTYIIYTDNLLTDGIIPTEMPISVHIKIPESATTFDRTAFEAALNTWFASCPQQFASVNL